MEIDGSYFLPHVRGKSLMYVHSEFFLNIYFPLAIQILFSSLINPMLDFVFILQSSWGLGTFTSKPHLRCIQLEFYYTYETLQDFTLCHYAGISTLLNLKDQLLSRNKFKVFHFLFPTTTIPVFFLSLSPLVEYCTEFQ